MISIIICVFLLFTSALAFCVMLIMEHGMKASIMYGAPAIFAMAFIALIIQGASMGGGGGGGGGKHG